MVRVEWVEEGGAGDRYTYMYIYERKKMVRVKHVQHQKKQRGGERQRKRTLRRAMMAVKPPRASLEKWIEENVGSMKKADGSGSGLRSAYGGSGFASTMTCALQAPVTCTNASGNEVQVQELFCKVASTRGAEAMFNGEAESLRALGAAGMRVPVVLGAGALPDSQPPSSFIVMEKLNLGGRLNQTTLGDALGKMHAAEPMHAEAKEGRFGFVCDNTIGATPQPNAWSEPGDWVGFFREKRLRHMIGLANDAQLSSLGSQLLPNIDKLFENINPVRPCILHGDLWSGNVSGLRQDTRAAGGPGVTIYDPACYYGHSEAEFGMSWCASFTSDFWKAYRVHVLRENGFEDRLKLYKLYHYLNHYVLFGGGYKAECVATMQALLQRV